jgi:LAO/AO transport system kinase
MADSTVLVLVPESGDGIQTLKSGIMEIGDIFVVNKADRTGADKLRQEIEVTLGIRRGNAFRNVPAHHGGEAGRRGSGAGRRTSRVRNVGAHPVGAHPVGAHSVRPSDNDPRLPEAAGNMWDQPVIVATAVKDEGVADLLAALDRHHEWLAQSGELQLRRRRRLMERTREVVDRATRRWVWEETRAEQLIADRLDEVAGGRLSPYELAAEVLEELKEGERI